jgi:hypothetical protein
VRPDVATAVYVLVAIVVAAVAYAVAAAVTGSTIVGLLTFAVVLVVMVGVR